MKNKKHRGMIFYGVMQDDDFSYPICIKDKKNDAIF